MSTFNDGAELEIDSIRFTSGGVNFKGVSQIGKKKQTLISNAGAITFNTNCTFDGIVNARFPNINFNGTVFKDSVIAIKTGGSTTCTGGNIFWGPVVLTSAGNNFWYLGNVNPDIFYENVSCYRQTNFVVDLARTATSEIYKNVSFYNTSTGDPTVGTNGGKLAFKGSASQILSYDKTSFFVVNNIILDKSSNHVTLNANVQVNTSIQFIKGNIITSSTKLIKINTTNVTGASALSFVEGPAQKLGNTAFTFPIGKNGMYQPISISAPLSNDLVTAEVFNSLPPNASSLSASIAALVACQYWQLDRTLSTALTVTLPWDSNTCASVTPSIVKLARFNGTQWIDASSGAGTGTSASGSISSVSLTITGNSNYFTFGNLIQATLKINTVNVNTGNFTITGSGMLPLDTLSGLSSSIVTVRPDLPSSGSEKYIILSIPSGEGRKELDIKVSYNSSSSITKVEAMFDNLYYPLNNEYYKVENGNELYFYKESPEGDALSITTNLKNGILLDTSGIFQIIIPVNSVFSNSILSIYNISGTTPVQVYGPQSILTWDASAASAGVYEFQLQLTASGVSKTYKGQFIKE